MPVANFREKKSNICQCPSQFYLDKILNLARQDPFDSRMICVKEKFDSRTQMFYLNSEEKGQGNV